VKKKTNVSTHLNSINQKKKPPYSVVYPVTNSDSASGKSNGALLVSNKKVIVIKPLNKKNKDINQ